MHTWHLETEILSSKEIAGTILLTCLQSPSQILLYDPIRATLPSSSLVQLDIHGNNELDATRLLRRIRPFCRWRSWGGTVRVRGGWSLYPARPRGSRCADRILLGVRVTSPAVRGKATLDGVAEPVVPDPSQRVEKALSSRGLRKGGARLGGSGGGTGTESVNGGRMQATFETSLPQNQWPARRDGETGAGDRPDAHLGPMEVSLHGRQHRLVEGGAERVHHCARARAPGPRAARTSQPSVSARGPKPVRAARGLPPSEHRARPPPLAT